MSLTRKKPMRRVSRKRAKENKEYAASRKAFLALRPICEVWVELSNVNTRAANLLKADIFDGEIGYRPVYSDDIHHKEGRAGEKFLDDTTWMALSRRAHRWIHDHPKQAKEMGWLK